MAYVPEDVEWFLAQLVEEIRVRGHRRNVVHVNYVLIQARKPAEAYRKALAYGKWSNKNYENPHGELVTCKFLGLRQLEAVYFPIEHGCELTYEERIGVRPAELRRLVRSKRNLDVFQDYPLRSPPGRPDYSSKEILDEIYRKLANEKRAKRTGSRKRRPGAAAAKRKRGSRRA